PAIPTWGSSTKRERLYVDCASLPLQWYRITCTTRTLSIENSLSRLCAWLLARRTEPQEGCQLSEAGNHCQVLARELEVDRLSCRGCSPAPSPGLVRIGIALTSEGRHGHARECGTNRIKEVSNSAP